MSEHEHFTRLCKKIDSLPVSTAYATKDMQIAHRKEGSVDTFRAQVHDRYLSLYVFDGNWESSVFIVRK